MDSLLGRTVTFKPYLDSEPRFQAEIEPDVIGTVIFDNVPHHFFVAEYQMNNYRLRESFHYIDIGEGVTVCD